MGFVTLLVGIGLLMTLASLAVGIGSMAHGGAFDRAHSVQFMWARVGGQAITVVVLLLALLLLSG